MNQKSKPVAIYIDDEEINLFIFKEMFRDDFEIYTAASAAEALIFLQKNEVDLIITDQLMPVMTGVEFLRRVKEIFPDMKARKVMVSGFIKEGEVAEALEEKLLDKFVKKPWQYEDLKGILLQSAS